MQVAAETAQQSLPIIQKAQQPNLTAVSFEGKKNIDDQKSKFVTFGFLNDLIKSVRRKKSMDYDDIQPVSQELQAFYSARRLALKYNQNVQLHQKKGKKMKGLISTAFGANKKRTFWLFVGVPFISLCGIASTIGVRQFTTFLTPGLFYDCDRLFTTDDYHFQNLEYSDGLRKAGSLLWGYVLLIFFSQLMRVLAESVVIANTMRIGVSLSAGMLDIIYNKILVLSDQARQSSATGNLVNLLFSDTQRTSLFITQIYICLGMPVDLVANFIYMATEIDPIALVGLAGYVVLLPVVGGILTYITNAQKRMMGFRDMRVKRSSEILNGIKVIKLFALEEIQEKRVFNTREREINMLFKFSVCMSFFSVIATLAAPLMTLVAFAAMIGYNAFDISSAFTTMYMFQYLAQVIIMLPMTMSQLSEAIISGNRMLTFIKLPEKDPGFVVRVDKLDLTQKKFLPESLNLNNTAVQIVGNPSFSWALASDQVVPPILDPFFKKNAKTLKKMKKSIAKEGNKSQCIIDQAILSYQESTSQFIQQDIRQLTIGFDQVIDDQSIIDRWCTELDLPYLKRMDSLESYNPINYQSLKEDDLLTSAKKQYLHIRTMQVFIKRDQSPQFENLPDVLKDINLLIYKHEIIGICGQVGNGKSSLFNAILGELRISEKDRKLIDTDIQEDEYIKFDYNAIKMGNKSTNQLMFSKSIPHVYLNGKVGFFSQSPAIFSKTIRDNICFGMPYNKQKYDKIVDICCLLPDFDIFDGGDLIEVGGKGVTLSGGQKARIALARAVYSEADILLLDDPLSAVDAHVGARIWNEVVEGYLRERGTTVIIASHQTHFFQSCNRVMQLVDGKIQAFDTPENLSQNGVQIMGLTTEQSSTKSKQANVNIGEQAVKTINLLNTEDQQATQMHKEGDIDKGKLVQQEQLSGQGNISGRAYRKWFHAGSLWLAIITIVFLVLQTAIAQYQMIMVTHWATDKYSWVKDSDRVNSTSMQDAFSKMKCKNDGNSYQIFDRTTSPPAFRLTSDCREVTQYKMEYSMMEAAKQSNAQQQQYVIQAAQMCNQQWFEMDLKLPSVTSNNYLGLYAGITVISALLAYFGNVAFAKFCLSAAESLHNKMISVILRVRMLFFDTTPQGRILNRLSKDTDSVDTLIMRFMQQALTMGLMAAGMAVSIAVTNYPALIVIVPAFIIFIIIFIQFRQVFPHIKRIESITRSPVFNTCQETVESMICIRAFDKTSMFQEQFREHVNINMCLYFENFAIMRWLALRLGILTSFFATLVSVAGILISPVNQDIASYTGVIVSNGQAISQILLQFVVTLVQVEGEMASVERITEFSDMQQEGVFEDKNFDNSHWPKEKCTIEVKYLDFRYNKKQDFILKNVDFKMNPKEHIGIVGRTGAGKSSITVSMFRLAEPENESQILIDGVNILKIGLHQSRRALSIIPQDPFLFSGTLRQNLCPVSQARAEGVRPPAGMIAFTDDRLWSVLEQVQMKEYFVNQPGGLDARIATNGDNLSAGQKQLVCVARALMRNSGCVILDEATAQVDRENDKLIQDTIRRTLNDTAVLSIAHRLDTIIDFDRVIVMDLGRIVEFDTPAALLQIEGGAFSQLVDRTGLEMSAKLRRAAIQADQQRKAGLAVQVDI